MRCVTGNAPFRFYRRMFVNKGTLFVDVTFDASCVGARGESCLFELKTAVRIVAIAAPHRAFQHLVMERQVKLVLGLHVATQAKLRFARFEQFQIGEPGFLSVAPGNEHVRRRQLPASGWRVRRMAIGTADIVAPVLAAAEVIVFLAARVARQTRLGGLFRRFVLEGNDLRRIAFLDVGFAWTMTRLATGHFFFPTADFDEFRVGCV